MKDSAVSCRAGHLPSAELVLTCGDLDAAVAFYVDRLGFRLDMTMPADAPTVALISGHGIKLRLQSTALDQANAPMPELRLPAELRGAVASAGLPASAPGGLRIAWQEPAQADPALAKSREFLLRRADSASAWVTGRAGMQYRDLIPGRIDGRVIASHIRIVEGGPVPDYVHFHEVGVQLIFCRRGWVRVIYEDQGPPFVLQPGDCVLQPPTIRHRVLEASAGLEVIEVGSPAQHATWRDHELALPTPQVDGERRFGGQRFVRHVAAQALWQSSAQGRLQFADTGIATWALLITPWAILAQLASLWLVWVLLVNLSVFLYYQVFHGIFGMLFSGDALQMALFGLNSVALCVWELAATRYQWLKGRTEVRLLAIMTGFSITWLMLSFIFGHGDKTAYVPIVYGLWLAVFYGVYRYKIKELFMLAGASFSVIILSTAWLGEVLFKAKDGAVLFLLALWVIFTSGIVIRWLKGLAQELHHD